MVAGDVEEAAEWLLLSALELLCELLSGALKEVVKLLCCWASPVVELKLLMEALLLHESEFEPEHPARQKIRQAGIRSVLLDNNIFLCLD